MKKSVLEFTNWVKAHPFKACLFAAITAALGAWDGTRPYLAWIDLLPWAVFLAAVALVIHWDGKGLTCLLIGALLCQPYQARAEEKKPAGAGVIVGIVVVVVGGFIVFRVIRFCQRTFPRPPANPNTNNPPALVFGEAHNYALATSCSAIGTCYVPSPDLLAEVVPDTVFEISGIMVEGPQGGLFFQMNGAKKLNPETDAVGLWEFQQGLAAWGVRFGSAGEVFYGVDGQPAGPDQVPITVTLNGANSSVDVSGGYGQAVTFERSSDLQHWEPILTMTVREGQPISFSDATTEGQMFYRSHPVGD